MEKRKNDMDPKVSIIMPTYNRGHILNQAIQSVAGQAYKNMELIIVDDGSTDHTEEIVKEISGLDIVYLKLEQNHGANYARNHGLKNAKGTYISFLDSDNIWEKDFLRSRIRTLEETQSDFVFGRVKIDYSETYRIEPDEAAEELQSRESLLKAMAFKNVVDTNTVCMNRRCYEDTGGFDEYLERCQDWEYFYRILRNKTYKYQFIDNILVKSAIQKDSISNNNPYWPARLYIFNKYISDYRACGFLPELMYLLYHQLIGSEVYHDLKEELFRQITEEEKLRLLLDIHGAKKEGEELIQTLSDMYNERCQKDDLIIKNLSNWLRLEREGIHIERRMMKTGIEHAAIYGYGLLGRHLYDACRKSGIKIGYLIDKNPSAFPEDIHEAKYIFNLKELTHCSIDLIVITAIYNFQEICRELGPLTNARLISLEDLIEENMI